MEAIKFTEDFLEKFFEDNTIEDDNLFDCLKGREGVIEETDESFENGGEEHMVLQIKLLMKAL